MNKKILSLIAASIIIVSFFASCGVGRQQPSVSEEGVVINGVRWATRNVDTFGTFTQNPEDAGMFFQWNRQKGWAATGSVTGWDTSEATTQWTNDNDPCPPGWRTPTVEEWRSLNATAGQYAVINGIRGRLFGAYPDLIFLPAAGRRNASGALGYGGYAGYYWSRSPAQGESAYTPIRSIWAPRFGLYGRVTTFTQNRNQGFSVRCVQE